MTYIQPHKNKSLLNRIAAGLVLGVLGGVFWLIAIYNNVVNLDHNIATLKTQLDSVGAKNTAMNNQVIATLGSGGLQDLASRDGLVTDNHPEYFPLARSNQSWPIASQQ